MFQAFVLFQVPAGKTLEVLEGIHQTEISVAPLNMEIYLTTGSFQIILKIEGSDPAEITNIVEKLHTKCHCERNPHFNNPFTIDSCLIVQPTA